MRFNIYRSLYLDCDESFIIEESSDDSVRKIRTIWCDDCNRKHDFQLSDSLKTEKNLLEVLKFEEKEEFSDE